MITFRDRFNGIKANWEGRPSDDAPDLVTELEDLIEEMLSQFELAQDSLMEARAKATDRRARLSLKLEAPTPQMVMDDWFVYLVDFTLALMRHKPGKGWTRTRETDI